MMWIQALTSLALTLALLVGGAWAFRRWGNKLGLSMAAGTPRIVVREAHRLNTTTTLHLVAVDGTEHLIATSGNQASLIATLPDAPSQPAMKKASPTPAKRAKVRGV